MSAIRITGRLLSPAHTATAADGRAWLLVRFTQGAHSLPIEARHTFGVGLAAQAAAANAAHHLRQRGQCITAHARTFRFFPWPEPHLFLMDVDLLEREALAPHPTKEPA